MRVPELLFPLAMKDIVTGDQVLTYWHDAVIIILPPTGTLTLTYRPRQDYYYLVFSLAMGTPRDFATGNALITDDYGFWHRHSQMRWHWNPGVESVYNFEEPEFLLCTRDDPVELEFINNSPLTVIHDINIHIFECSVERWPIVRDYLRGLHKFVNLFNILDDISKDMIKLTLQRALAREQREPLPPPRAPPAPGVPPEPGEEEPEDDPPRTRYGAQERG